MVYVFFFKQKTAYEMRISDWSSDVCSSDLDDRGDGAGGPRARRIRHTMTYPFIIDARVEKAAREGAVFALNLSGGKDSTMSAHAEIGRASCRERVCQYV